MEWTPEQKAVIEARDRNLLVAAAAGSGKTAVLVEHILEQICDPVHPVPVTGLLVVTFTRAAAAEMKERLRVRLAERLEEEPWNLSIQRQISQLDLAQICTIDSFCQWMVKNYFYRLDLDPDFRIPDEGESRLIREEILDGFFEEGNEKYFRLLDAFGGGKNDRAVREMIESLYTFADSAPFPDRWLNEQRERLKEQDASLEESCGDGELERQIRETLSECRGVLKEAARTCAQTEGLDRYEQMFSLDVREMDSCLQQEGLTELLRALGEVHFSRKPVIPKKLAVDEEAKAAFSSLRDLVKKQVTSLEDRYAAADPEQSLAWIRASEADCLALLDLTQEFAEKYRQEKRERNLADFADIEHWALELLVTWEDGETVPTPLAAELGDRFHEILVDEYQDSNLVQEMILATLSGEQRGRPNLFMVGDVKQSIYKFRMARPELFIEKYRRYSADPLPSGQKIDLNRNFRSRRTILETVNGLFGKIMGEKLGGIAYDEAASLHCGASYPAGDEPVELLLTERKDSGLDAAEAEGERIAQRIRELTNPDTGAKVWDEKKQEFRPARYRDIVILLRSMEGRADRFADILNREEIPAYAQQKKGYFAAREVQVLLDFLRILDNPLQDIPLASVLLSPIGGFTGEELARMTAGRGDGDFYRRLCDAAAEGGIGSGKWQRFEELLSRYREEAAVRPIHEILENILAETDYGLILEAEPGGAVRAANVGMLMERAMTYEESSYHGIFHFIRYMEKLQQYEIDFGEAQVLSENEDLVRITTIHRSKGLEYPIVIVAGVEKHFNLQDERKPVLMHEDLGLACDAVDPEEGILYPNLRKRMTADRMERDAKGEELRILYVALTRAKERLILSGTCRSFEDERKRWSFARNLPDGTLPAFVVGQASSFLDWIVMAMAAGADRDLSVRLCPAGQPVSEGTADLTAREQQRQEWLLAAASPDVQDEAFAESFREICTFVYPWQSVCHRKAALSVSELKEQTREEAEAGEQAGDEDSAGSVGSAEGARRGTAFHTLLKWIPPEKGSSPEAVAETLAELAERGILTEEEQGLVEIPAVTAFFGSELGTRMQAAAREGRLFREQPFVMSVPLAETLPEEERASLPPDERVLVQGIIDAFIEEEDGIILWDYKTDRVSRRDGAERLLTRYREQLWEYRRALERAAAKPVKEMWIYSFALQEAIRVPEP